MRKKTLFLGNGICRAFAEKTTGWKDLLVQTFARDINSVNQFEEYVPYYMYPLLLDNGQSISEAIRRNKEKFYGFNPNDEMIEYVRKLLDLGFDDIITTNYSYEIERCILGSHISNEKLDKVKPFQKIEL